LKSSRGIVCRECRGLNKPDSRYCWFCGAPLPRFGRGPGGRRTALGVALEVLKWLGAGAVVLALIAGVYYAVERVILPIFQQEETPTTLIARSTSTVRSTTTTTTTPREDRVVTGGADRYATAVAISELGFPEGASALVLVDGEQFAEALSAGPLAAAYGGPVLLVPPEGIRDDLTNEIERLDPSRVFLVGVSKPRSVTARLEEILEKPEVTSFAGDDPYETAALIAREIEARLETVARVVIAPADSFIEAIAVTPLAAAKGWPILLADGDRDLPGATAGVIEDLRVDAALVVGTAIDLSLTDVEMRVGGSGFDTAALIAEYAATQGSDFAHTVIASGDAFPDGLAAGSYLAADNGILLLAKNGRLPPSMLSLFTDNRKAIRTLDFIALPELAKELALPTTGRGGPGTTGQGPGTTDSSTAGGGTTGSSTAGGGD